jgi:glycosyltransferase involved in cell wall biosynthesis
VHGFTSAIWHRRQTHLIACSSAVKQDLIAKGFNADKITVMHYPIDPDDLRPIRPPAVVRAELGAAADTPIVGAFAHLSVKKGHRELVRAAEILLRRTPAAQFWCFGEGPLRTELEETAKTLGIADRFRVFGFRRDVPDLMHAIDVMCLPSHREPFGQVYVEAALAEKPVIACNAGGAPEIVVHGETGLLVPPPERPGAKQPASNIAALAEAISTIFEDRRRASAMGRKGRELALRRFGWPEYLARLNQLYGRILGDDRALNRRAA